MNTQTQEMQTESVTVTIRGREEVVEVATHKMQHSGHTMVYAIRPASPGYRRDAGCYTVAVHEGRSWEVDGKVHPRWARQVMGPVIEEVKAGAR